jgi:hypothetical protein
VLLLYSTLRVLSRCGFAYYAGHVAVALYWSDECHSILWR